MEEENTSVGNRIRRHQGTVVAIGALVFAMVGSAAATQVLVQRGTRVVTVVRRAGPASASKKGRRGPAGPQGQAGQKGATGATGHTGPAGPFVETLPSGSTLRGIYAVRGVNAYAAISLSPPLAAQPTFDQVKYVQPSDSRPAGCPSTNADAVPQASPGWFCIYAANNDSLSNVSTMGYTVSQAGVELTPTPIVGTSAIVLEGRYAVTAP